MNLSAIAIKRPVFTVMVTVALMVLGSSCRFGKAADYR